MNSPKHVDQFVELYRENIYGKIEGINLKYDKESLKIGSNINRVTKELAGRRGMDIKIIFNSNWKITYYSCYYLILNNKRNEDQAIGRSEKQG